MGYEMDSFEQEATVSHKKDSRRHGCGSGLNCVCQVVRAIKDIQDEATEEECLPCTSNCFVEPLGDLAMPIRDRADTRVFTLTGKNGELLKGLFRGHSNKCVSVFFRVEDIFDNCCATLRVLVPLTKDKQVVDLITSEGKLNLHEICKVKRWARSNSCITVDLHCFCAVQCIADVDLDICD